MAHSMNQLHANVHVAGEGSLLLPGRFGNGASQKMATSFKSGGADLKQRSSSRKMQHVTRRGAAQTTAVFKGLSESP